MSVGVGVEAYGSVPGAVPSQMAPEPRSLDTRHPTSATHLLGNWIWFFGVSGFGFGVAGLGFMVLGLGLRVSGSGFRVWGERLGV